MGGGGGTGQEAACFQCIRGKNLGGEKPTGRNPGKSLLLVQKKLIAFFNVQYFIFSLSGSCQPPSSAEDPDIEAKEYEGEIEIPNLSEENDMEDVDVIVTAKKSSRDATKLKELTHKMAPKMIREQLSTYLKTMTEGIYIYIYTIIINSIQSSSY